jgi:hypothetical protein
MDIRQSSFNFPKTDGSGPQPASAQIQFPRSVLNVAVGIVGYSATFENRQDHHLGRLIVELNANINGDNPNLVDVSGAFGLRDWSGEWDDPYSGIIDFAVFAELVGVTPPPPGSPRGDLLIVDAEITQVIQHFRSDRHLNAANVFPDNSIRLVANKPTVVRLYVDYDATSGLPVIGTLSGEFRVSSNGTVSTLSPLEAILPRRDGSIDRGRRDHTLNFLIPETACLGQVDITARVFDASDNTQFSVDFVRSLTFETFPALPILAVGIEYTGPDVSDPTALAAPTMADFVGLFGFTEALYPIPEVTITNFLTMTYDREVKSDIGQGCDKLGDLKDAVAELKGDSNDIVYGLFNTGLDTGSVGGCGGSEGAAVGRIGSQGTAAHEVGHALGRKHAPCDNVTRCAEPLDTDDNYPNYVGYDSDSIGEYGFDLRNPPGSVKNPSNSHDMMGYSGGRWISPYTYKALMSRIPETFAAASASLTAPDSARLALRAPDVRGDWIPIKTPHLFLRLEIGRDRSVQFHPAFHYAARPRPHGDKATGFIMEQQDEKGRVLRSACLHAEDGGCGCCAARWPLRIRQAVPFDTRARTLVLFECDKEIGTWPIPDTPKVIVDVTGEDSSEHNDIEVTWRAGLPDGEREGGLWFLVQWRDRLGTWRGLAPRTQRMQLTVPKRIFRGEGQSVIRVLASSGIATGEGIWQGQIVPPRGTSVTKTQPSGLEIRLADVGKPGPGSHDIPRMLRATALTEAGGVAPGARLRWYDSKGAEIGRGRALDLSQLRAGQHLITARVLDTGFGGGSQTWLIQHTADGRFLLLVGNQKKSRPGQKHSRE